MSRGAFSVDRLSDALNVRGRGGKPESLKRQVAKLKRLGKRAPEVVIKVRGGGTKGPGHVLAHMTYITRNGKLDAYNERGEKITGRDELKEVLKEWGISTARASTRRRAETVNMVLSMPAGTDPEAVLRAAQGFAKNEFSRNHQYLMALHTDQDHPHVHLSVKAQGFDMTWLRRSKADLQNWREGFAEQLRDQGIEAEATPRKARGVVTKSRNQAMHHLAREPKRSTVITAKVDEAIREVTGQTDPKPRPWESAIKAQQKEVRETFHAAVDTLRRSPDPDDRRTADNLANFLQQMPPVQTEGDRLRQNVAAMLKKEREMGANQGPAGPEIGS